jgi:hypothetical protein
MSRVGFAGAVQNVGDVRCHLTGALRGLLDVAGVFLRRRALLLDGRRMVDEISEMRLMVLVISRIARTELSVALCIAEICCPISPAP